MDFRTLYPMAGLFKRLVYKRYICWLVWFHRASSRLDHGLFHAHPREGIEAIGRVRRAILLLLRRHGFVSSSLGVWPHDPICTGRVHYSPEGSLYQPTATTSRVRSR